MQTTFGTGNAGNLQVIAEKHYLVGSHTNTNGWLFLEHREILEISQYKQEISQFKRAHQLVLPRFFGSGNGGTLDVIASNIIIAGIDESLDPFNTDFTGISTATNTGIGGNLHISADNITVENKGQITSLSIGQGKSRKYRFRRK